MSSDVEGDKLAAVLLHYGVVDRLYSREMKVVCPFHPDKNPSMKVNFDDGFFYCFGCGARGNAEDFVRRIEKQNGMNDIDALVKYNKIVKGIAGSTESVIKKVLPEATRSSQRSLYDSAYSLYHGLPKVSWMSPGSSEVLKARDYMLSRGFNIKSLEMSGCRYTYKDDYPLMFPIMDNGKFRGWVCRTTDPEVESYRKYLYNKGFRRATTLVGDYGKFGNELDDYVFVVEGFMDRLKLLQFGVKNVVAIFGWKMSEVQIKKLKDCGIMTIVSTLDNDECGKKGTKYLREHFNVIRFKYLKGVKDPGDMDRESFGRMFEKTMLELHQVLRSRDGNSR